MAVARGFQRERSGADDNNQFGCDRSTPEESEKTKMTDRIHLALMILSCACFALCAVNRKSQTVDLLALGLFLWVLGILI